MIGEDVFEMDIDQNIVQKPKTPNLRLSACTPLWFVVFRNRPSARCVIHTHSMNAVMATLLDPTEKASSLKVTYLEMLKGVGNHAYDDVLEVPIIDNRPSEELLAEQLEAAIKKYPKCNAVLVRRHGLYVWGDSWEQAKTQCESFDYLFECAVKMRSMGLDPAMVPQSGTYREDEKNDNKANTDEPATKKRKHDTIVASTTTTTTTTLTNDDKGFRGHGNAANQSDVDSNKIPLLPKNSKILLLDIEGCTTSIAFVKEQLFPYVLNQLDTYLPKQSQEVLDSTLAALQQDFEKLPSDHPSNTKEELDMSNTIAEIASRVRALMKHDVKATGLKSLQGKMWKSGYDSGEIRGHIYDDFLPTLQWCQTNNVQVYIYSSGSIGAQKLLFGKSSQGDLLSYLQGHFDTTSGPKKEAGSYTTIAKSMNVPASAITFVSDAEGELVAARAAGVGHVVMSVRPGNAPLTSVGHEFPIVHSLLQLCGK